MVCSITLLMCLSIGDAETVGLLQVWPSCYNICRRSIRTVRASCRDIWRWWTVWKISKQQGSCESIDWPTRLLGRNFRFCDVYFCVHQGSENGWLNAKEYAPLARKAWLTLVPYVNEDGDVTEICIGTDRKNDKQYYYDRKRCIGDYHGQLAFLWCVVALLEWYHN